MIEFDFFYYYLNDRNVNKKSDEGLYECVIDLSAKTHFYLKVMGQYWMILSNKRAIIEINIELILN